jgi:hypothetical protein
MIRFRFDIHMEPTITILKEEPMNESILLFGLFFIYTEKREEFFFAFAVSIVHLLDDDERYIENFGKYNLKFLRKIGIFIQMGWVAHAQNVHHLQV